jgi:hypothetical protein
MILLTGGTGMDDIFVVAKLQALRQAVRVLVQDLGATGRGDRS